MTRVTGISAQVTQFLAPEIQRQARMRFSRLGARNIGASEVRRTRRVDRCRRRNGRGFKDVIPAVVAAGDCLLHILYCDVHAYITLCSIALQHKVLHVIALR